MMRLNQGSQQFEFKSKLYRIVKTKLCTENKKQVDLQSTLRL